MIWDDLRFFLELARAGRLTIAARRLGVEHTTVARRVQALEVDVSTTLFNRNAEGYELTPAGRLLLPIAQSMESAYLQTERLLPNLPGPMEGLVRIGCNEGYGTTVLPKHLAGLIRNYPGLSIEILAVPRAIQLTRQEADIVVSIDRPARGPYKVVRLTDYELGLYASDSYLQMHPQISRKDDLRGHSFVNYIENLALAKNIPTPDAVTKPGASPIRSTSILAQRTAAEAGVGIAILPCYLVQADSPLRPVLPLEVSFRRTYWMMSQIDLFKTARVRTTWDFMRDEVASDPSFVTT
jgi:DNA-binding transcriptional LysR family regulator